MKASKSKMQYPDPETILAEIRRLAKELIDSNVELVLKNNETPTADLIGKIRRLDLTLFHSLAERKKGYQHRAC